MPHEISRHGMRITDEVAWTAFTEVANAEGFGLGKHSNTYWDFVKVLLESYKRHQAIDNVFDRIELKIRDIKAITPQKIKDLVTEALQEFKDQDLPIVVRACIREELNLFERESTEVEG